VDSGLIDMDQFISWLGRAGTLSPDFAKQGVEVLGVPAVLQYGKSATLTVQGWDMTSNLAQRNLTATLSFVGGKATQKVSIDNLHLDGVPTRDGRATVTFKMTGALLPASNKGTQYLQLVGDQTGTKVTVPVTVKG
jgi:5'-nucleotidase